MMDFKFIGKKEPVECDVESPLCLAEFSNADIKFKNRDLLKFQSYKSSAVNGLNKPKRCLVASNNRMQYGGSNYESERSKIKSSVLKVGVYKKSSHSIKFYDVDLFHLKPLLKSQPSIKCSIEETWSKQSENLSLAFGSKAKAKAVASKRRYESIGNGLNNIPAIIESYALEDKSDVIDEQEPEAIPAKNQNATTANEVYDIYHIISKDVYNLLDSEAGVFVNATYADIELWKNDERYCHFIIQYLQSRYQSLTIHNAKLLCYFHYMMCFLKTTYKEWQRKDPVPEVPQPFKKNLRNRYVLKNSMPQRMKDKLLAEAMILALTINNYIIDGKSLSISSKISIKRLVLIAYALGCHVSDKREDMKLIQLKLPLYKYQPRTFKRK